MKSNRIKILFVVIVLCISSNIQSDYPKTSQQRKAELEMQLRSEKEKRSYLLKTLEALSWWIHAGAVLAGGSALAGATFMTSYLKNAQKNTPSGSVPPMVYSDYLKYFYSTQAPQELGVQDWISEVGIEPYSPDEKSLETTESFIEGLGGRSNWIVAGGLSMPVLVGIAFMAGGLSAFLESQAKTEKMKELEQQIADIK